MKTPTHHNAIAQAVLEEARTINAERLSSVETLARLVADRSDLKQRLEVNAKHQHRRRTLHTMMQS